VIVKKISNHARPLDVPVPLAEPGHDWGSIAVVALLLRSLPIRWLDSASKQQQQPWCGAASQIMASSLGSTNSARPYRHPKAGTCIIDQWNSAQQRV